MADETGQPTSSLRDAAASLYSTDVEAPGALGPFLVHLARELFQYDFYAAVRKLECLTPHLPRVGHSLHPNEDAVRFGQLPSLQFAATEMAELVAARVEPREHPMRLLVNFFGLLGPNGPLPLVHTDWIRNRRALFSDPTLAEFLDLFHHRLMCLFYRAWSQANQAAQFDRRTLGQVDRFADYIGSLCGLGVPAARGIDEVGDLAKLHYAGLLQSQTRNADGLESILQGYFQMNVSVMEFVGEWVDIPGKHRCKLVKAARNLYLGAPPPDPLADDDADDRPSGVIVGSRVWNCQNKFRIRVGPLSFKDYERMLPGGNSLRHLVAWVRQYVGDELTWDVQLILRADDIPKTLLGQVGQLGWTTWIPSREIRQDAQDLIIQPACRPQAA